MSRQKVVRIQDLQKLDAVAIALHLNDFLGNDAEDNQYNSTVLARLDFKPDTFYVAERMSDPNFLAPEERNGEDWVQRFTAYELDLLEKQGVVVLEDQSFVTDFIIQQLSVLLSYRIGEAIVAEVVANQEFPDVLRKVIAYCLTGNPNYELYPSRSFNELARDIVPYFLDKYILGNYNTKELLMYAIAGRMIGLDMKGPYSAASPHPSRGLELKPLRQHDKDFVANSVYLELEKTVSRGLAIDYWDAFFREILQADQDCTLAWFSDDYIDTLFDLVLVQDMLSVNRNLRVVLIPKNGRYGNDASFSDVREFLSMSLFHPLSAHWAAGRFHVLTQGPRMAAISLRKLSKEAVDIILNSKAVLVKGCRAHEMVQGGLDAVVYTAFVVARGFTERETGLDARKSPLVFVRSDPGEYCYWGFKESAQRTKVFPDGREIPICASTLEEHERRKTTTNIPELIRDLEDLTSRHDQMLPEYMVPFKEEIRLIVDRLVDLTRISYEATASQYEGLRRQYPDELEIELFEKLFKLAQNRVKEGLLGDSKGILNLLDVGTGHGRDLRYFCQIEGVRAVGIDNAKGFLKILEKLAEAGEIPRDSFLQMDMRCLDGFEDASFDMVRNNATLLHLPLTPVGIGADEAVAETFRVLKPFGLFFVFTKAGQGLQYIDTGEGLGGRMFQLYTRQSLVNLLQKHGFKVLDVVRRHSERPSGPIEWIGVYVEKPGK